MMVQYVNGIFLLIGFVIAPLLCYGVCRWLLPRRWRCKIGVAGAAVIILLTAYGWTFGSQQLTVRPVTIVCSDLPQAFDGYRIVQFSDAHVGTMTGWRKAMLQRAVDSIMNQRADMIVFTGDLQNIEPHELPEHLAQLSRLKAPDGVYSVLGNHDYAVYQKADSATKAANCRLTCEYERRAGWQLLLNEHRTIRRGSDSLIVAGMENWGVAKRMPHRGDVGKTLAGLQRSAFVVMLEHDPSAWRARILPESWAQLTLSGHTHGGQLRLFGWSPVSFTYDEWGGLYHEGRRHLFVSTGLGGLIPIRLGISGEIVVITLKKTL